MERKEVTSLISIRRLNVFVVALALSGSAALVAIGTPFGSPTQADAAACTSSVGPGIAPPPTVPSGIPGFHAAWFGQSGYPTLCPGERSTATVAYYNSGTRGWLSGVMGQMAFLGTWDPLPGQDKASPLGGDGTNGSPATGWPRYNRVAAQPAEWVGPNQVSWFQFTIQAPTTPGTYLLYIRPLVEGAQWMEDFGVYWQVTVKPAEAQVGVSVTPTGASSVSVGGTRDYTVTVSGLTGCVDLAFVDAANFPADGTFRDADGDAKADLTNTATFASVNGVTVNSSYIDCVAIPSTGTFTISATSSTANAFVRPVVFLDANGNNALDLDSGKRPTETSFGVGGPVRFLPPSATFGSHTVTVGLVNTAERFFTDAAAMATYRYDTNDTFQYGGIGVSISQFEQVLSTGDTLNVSYNPDPAGVSTFNITNDVGRQAPTVGATVGSFDGGATQNDVRLTITEPSSNIDAIAYSVQRTTVAASAAACDANSGTYAEIATVSTASGSDTATYTDGNLANGTYCYRVGAANPVTSRTAFGYSAPTTVAGSPAAVNPPTSADARVVTNAGFTSTFDSGDVIKIAFSKAITAPANGATVRAQDGDGTIADLICGTNATCTLNASAETLGGVSYPVNSVLTISLTGGPSIVAAGSTPALQIPATVTDSSGIRDSSNSGWDLASSADVVLGSPD